MKTRVYLILAVSAILCAACGPHVKPDPAPDPEDGSLWRMKNDPVEKIDVYSDGELLETYEFWYNHDCDMVACVIRTDKTTGGDIMKVDYTYQGSCTVTARVTMFGAGRTVKALFDEDRESLQYGPEEDAAFRYKMILDSYNSLPVTNEMTYAYACDMYNSNVNLKWMFTEEEGDITSVSSVSNIRTVTEPLVTVADARSGIRYTYTYSEDEDLQNFAAFLMPCDFPLWFAAELPGCKHLITGMTSKCGNVPLPESFAVKYVLNDNGSIRTATRTDYTRGEKVSERRYEYSYL